MKKTLALLLTLAMSVSVFAGCGGTAVVEKENNNTEVSTQVVDDRLAAEVITVDMATYDAKSAEVYNAALGEFITTYEAAKAVDNVSERQALMAIAEAKLMESAVMLPTTTRGGNYAISRVAPYTVPYSLWGNDPDRFYTTIVATEPITKEQIFKIEQMLRDLKVPFEKILKSLLQDDSTELDVNLDTMRDMLKMLVIKFFLIWETLIVHLTLC